MLALVHFLPGGFLSAVLGPPFSTISIDARSSLLIKRGDKLVQHFLLLGDGQDVFADLRSNVHAGPAHDKEPPFPGVTQCILLHVPATINDPSFGPCFGITLPGVAMSLDARSKIASRIVVAMVVMPLAFAVMLRPRFALSGVSSSAKYKTSIICLLS